MRLYKKNQIRRETVDEIQAVINNSHITDGNAYDINHARILVTKKSKGSTLSEWLQKYRMFDDSFIDDVLFQVAYALLVFKDFQFMHHDLHAGNIFVEKLSTPLHLSFDVGDGVKIVRDVKYFVEIYDFDNSSTTTDKIVKRNSLLDSQFCASLGQCNTFFDRMEWFTILVSINHVGRRWVRQVHDCVKKKEMLEGYYGKEKLAFQGRPCVRNQGGDCSPIALTDSIITSPHQFLLTNFKPAKNKNISTAFSRPGEHATFPPVNYGEGFWYGSDSESEPESESDEDSDGTGSEFIEKNYRTRNLASALNPLLPSAEMQSTEDMLAEWEDI
jgi:serine/threonine protein kinase